MSEEEKEPLELDILAAALASMLLLTEHGEVLIPTLQLRAADGLTVGVQIMDDGEFIRFYIQNSRNRLSN